MYSTKNTCQRQSIQIKEVFIGNFWIRVCACESGVARESKSERDPFEMMLNIEEDMAMQNLGDSRCGK